MTVFLPKGSIMLWNGTAITEHNRQPLAVTIERIENAKRMANGTMRKYVIADKRKWTTSWSDLPDATSATVDGKEGGTFIENFYNTTHGVFTLKIMTSLTVGVTYTVMITSFNKTLKKRGRYEAYDVDVELTEV